MFDIYGIYTRVQIIDLDKWTDDFACDQSHERKLRSCEEFDNFTENQLISFDQQGTFSCANFRQLYSFARVLNLTQFA